MPAMQTLTGFKSLQRITYKIRKILSNKYPQTISEVKTRLSKTYDFTGKNAALWEDPTPMILKAGAEIF